MDSWITEVSPESRTWGTNPSANIVISWLDLNHDGRNRIHMTVTGFILMRMAVTEIRGLTMCCFRRPEQKKEKRCDIDVADVMVCCLAVLERTKSRKHTISESQNPNTDTTLATTNAITIIP